MSDASYALGIICNYGLQGIPVKGSDKLIGINGKYHVMRSTFGCIISGSAEIVNPAKFIDFISVFSGCFLGGVC